MPSTTRWSSPTIESAAVGFERLLTRRRRALPTCPAASCGPDPPRAAPACSIADMLVESVPNVSEGRRLDVVERLAGALTSVPGVFLLDRTSDSSHNRSVFTVAGEHDAVSAGLERLVAAAIDEIDMDQHSGEHPRIGAVDVVPFVPLGDTTLEDCIELARTFGQRIASRFRPRCAERSARTRSA